MLVRRLSRGLSVSEKYPTFLGFWNILASIIIQILCWYLGIESGTQDATESSIMDIQSLLNPSPPLTDVRPSSPLPPSTPKRYTPMLTRDQRIQVQALRGIGWSRGDIARHLRSLGVLCTERQVQWAETHRSTPQKHRCKVGSILDTSTRHRMIEFIISSQRTRRISYI